MTTCPHCQQRTGESIEAYEVNWMQYQCADCGTQWQADAENTTPVAITTPTA